MSLAKQSGLTDAKRQFVFKRALYIPTTTHDRWKPACVILRRLQTKGLFTWSGGPRTSGVGFFCFHALVDTEQKKRTPLDRGPPLHVNRV